MKMRFGRLLAGLFFVALASPAFAACPYTGNTQGTDSEAMLKALNDICAGTGGGTAGATYTDASIASATGSSQTVAALSATRRTLLIANPGTTTWWISPSGGTAAANCGGCFELPPGSYWSPKPAPINAVTGIGTSTSKLTVVGG